MVASGLSAAPEAGKPLMLANRRGCGEGLSAEALLERLMGEVKGFREEVPQGDDQTVVVLKVEK